jgi:transposase
MDHYTGIDVSLESSSLCVVDATGRVVREAKIASEPEALTAWLKNLGLEIVRIGLEAGPLSQRLYAGMKQAGLPAELLETRHVRTAFKIMPVKTDRKDARGIAQLMRLGWFRPVHCKSLAAQETRALLEYAMIDATIMRAHQHSAGAKKKLTKTKRLAEARGV